MPLPGFVAQQSLYRTRVTYRQATSANSGAGTGAVRAQWDVCTGCSAGESLQYCCDYSPGISGCAWVPCPCTPGCGACVLSANSPTLGRRSCWDANCNPLPEPCRGCECTFCDRKLMREVGPEACYTDCLNSNCAQTDQDCMDNCYCCCNSYNQAALCDCMQGVWTNGRCILT